MRRAEQDHPLIVVDGELIDAERGELSRVVVTGVRQQQHAGGVKFDRL